MARPLRLEFPGALFHVIARGDAKQRIFFDDRDRAFFIDLLGECVTRFAWILTAYSVMPNHFHLLVQITNETLSKGMQWLNTSYAVAFNQRHRRVGHVLQGRFKSPLVEKETYLLELVRYIVLNPVRANIVTRPEEDCWTSYRATIGLACAPDWLAVDDVLLPFGRDRDLARSALRDFVNAAIGIDSGFWRALSRKAYLGSEPWLEEIRERVELRPRSIEHPFKQRIVEPPSMSRVISAVADSCGVDETGIRCGGNRTARMIAAWVAWKNSHMTITKIAEELRLSRSRVSQLLRICRDAVDRDAVLRETVSTISRKLTIYGLTPNSSS
jgi:REP-associated tyrosine transposase